MVSCSGVKKPSFFSFWYGNEFILVVLRVKCRKMQIFCLRVTHIMSAGLGKVCEKEGIKEVADLVQDAIKVNKKIVIIIVIDGDVTNATITLTNTIKAIS